LVQYVGYCTPSAILCCVGLYEFCLMYDTFAPDNLAVCSSFKPRCLSSS